MRKSKIFLVRLSIGLILTALIFSCNNKKIEKTLSVNAEIADLGARPYGNQNFYLLSTKITITNNLEVNKEFWVMACAWEQSFITDNKHFYFQFHPCNANYRMPIKLKPHQSITFNGLLAYDFNYFRSVNEQPKEKEKQFRIGLLILNEKDLELREIKKNESKETYWSNTLILDDNGGFSKKDLF